jgi:hypothetical protein
MGNSTILIVIVVTIIAVKLFAVHYYLKTKINKTNKDNNDHEQD